MIKESTQEAITLINIYASNIVTPKYIKQILTDIKGEIDVNTVIGDFNTPLTSMDRSSRQKINKAIKILSDTTEQLYLTEVFRTIYIQNPQNIHSFPVQVEYSLRLTIYWGTKLTSTNLRV